MTRRDRSVCYTMTVMAQPNGSFSSVYRNPAGQQIEIFVGRQRASDTTRRIGSLFLNPGGPGGAGVTDGFLTIVSELVAPEIRARFDLVSWDPRGVPDSAILVESQPGQGSTFWFTARVGMMQARPRPLATLECCDELALALGAVRNVLVDLRPALLGGAGGRDHLHDVAIVTPARHAADFFDRDDGARGDVILAGGGLSTGPG